jgi:hypothetical protein
MQLVTVVEVWKSKRCGSLRLVAAGIRGSFSFADPLPVGRWLDAIKARRMRLGL